MPPTFTPRHFLPPGLNITTLPKELQQAIKEILEPAYQELVVDAPDALERSAGLTLVHLLFLELF